MSEGRGRKLLRNLDHVVYWWAAAPVLGRLPPSLGYRIACWRGDWFFWSQAGKRAEMVRNLRLVLGDEVSPAAAQRVTRDWFRFASCEVVDLKRLRHQAQPLRRLVEIRGREHLEAALAAGKGAIICTGHFGSHSSAFSVLHASGFPVTTIGRWWYKYTPDISAAERRLWDLYLRPVRRHRQRPNIEPWPGRVQVALQAAAVLRGNEVVTICSEAPPLDAELNRTIEVPFLGRQARFLPGVVTLAQVTGAPVLMISVHRAADYRHQVLEISPPVPMEGETAIAFERCATAIGAAITAHPAEWDFWFEQDDLARLGLLRDAHPATSGGPGS